MTNATETGLMAMCGGRYAVVPADVLTDKSLTRSARCLFGVLCSHADRKSHLRRSLKRIAKQEGVTVRIVQKWYGELEKAGVVVKLNEAGKMGVFQVIRHPKDRPAARAQNAGKILKRRLEFSVYGRKGAAERARQRAAAGTEPLNESSPPPEQHFTGTGVNVVSPKQESLRTRKEEQEFKQADDAQCGVTEDTNGTTELTSTTTTEANGTDGASVEDICLQGGDGGQAQAERQHLESLDGAASTKALPQRHGMFGQLKSTKKQVKLDGYANMLGGDVEAWMYLGNTLDAISEKHGCTDEMARRTLATKATGARSGPELHRRLDAFTVPDTAAA